MSTPNVIEIVEQRLDRGDVGDARAVAGLVPDGDDVLGAVSGEVGAEPQLLGGASGTPSGDQLALAVQVDDVPVAAGMS